MKNLKIVKTNSHLELAEENKVLTKRLKGFEQIVESLSLEVDRLRRVNLTMQKSCRCQKVIQNRKAA